MSNLATPLPPPMAPPPMAPPPPAASRRMSRTSRVLVTLALLAVVVSVLTISSLALFTDTENVGANTFGTGTVDISANPATAVVTAPAMAPGDQVTAPLLVSNDGTLQLRYAVTSTTTEDTLAGELVFTVKTGVTTCDDANWAADGSVVYSGALGTVASSAIFGDPTAGADAGDRTLAPAASETLCLNVTLPLSATNASQGMTTTATLDFEAEQTANNP